MNEYVKTVMPREIIYAKIRIQNISFYRKFFFVNVPYFQKNEEY